jgi:hypothetical protein
MVDLSGLPALPSIAAQRRDAAASRGAISRASPSGRRRSTRNHRARDSCADVMPVAFDYFVILGDMRTGSNLLEESLERLRGSLLPR